MRRRRTSAGALADLEELADKSALLAATASTSHPAVVMTQVGAIIDKWREQGRPFLFDNDHEIHAYYRAACERILVVMLKCLEDSIKAVAERIEAATAAGEESGFTIHDLLRAAESMSSQMAQLRGLQQPKAGPRPPENPEDLERRIAELEAKRQQRLTYVVKQ